MKMFWVLIGVLVVAAGVLLVVDTLGGREQRQATSDQRQGGSTEPAANGPKGAKGMTPETPRGAASVPEEEAGTQTLKALEDVSKQAPAVTADAPAAGAVPRGHGTSGPLKISPPMDGEGIVAPAAGGGALDTPATPPTNAPATIGKYEVEGEAIEAQDDGSLVVAGTFTVRGEGTVEKPYEVPWEMLIAAEKQFNPAMKRQRIPEGIAMLHGKVVRLAGYVAFPLMTQTPRELLAMLNQWDGCCIGVPPTPYDAVEVRLAKTVSGDARFAISGTVTGVFEVVPFVQGNWLVGLYVMKQAEFEPKDYGAGVGS